MSSFVDKLRNVLSTINKPFHNTFEVTRDINDIVNTIPLVVVVNTYSDMIKECIGNNFKQILVINDENKGSTYTSYSYYPNNVVLWNAAVIEIEF